MRLLDRIRDAFDAPRFCRECGEPIEVDCHKKFNDKTGAPSERWTWSCPKVYLTVEAGGIRRAEQSGYSIHPYGNGRPRWHVVLRSEPDIQ